MCAQPLRIDTCRSPFVFVNRQTREVAAFRCRSWTCPSCRPVKARQLAAAIARAANDHKLNRLATLTLDPKRCTGHPLDHLWTSWRRLRDGLKRLHPTLEAIAIVEHTRAGTPHLHVLWNIYIRQRDLSARWKRASNGSYIVDLRRVDTHRVTHYVAKYLTKATPVSVPARRRRYNSSRGLLPTRKHNPNSPWSLGTARSTPVLHTSDLFPDWVAVSVEVFIAGRRQRLRGSLRLADVIGLA